MYIHLNICKQMSDVNSLLLPSSTWKHLTVYKQMIDYIYLIQMYKQDSATYNGWYTIKPNPTN